MSKAKDISILAVLSGLYLLLTFHYYPGRLADSLISTFDYHIKILPFEVGLTLVSVSFLKKISEEILSWTKIVRIFLTVGIALGFLYGIYMHLGG